MAPPRDGAGVSKQPPGPLGQSRLHNAPRCIWPACEPGPCGGPHVKLPG